MRFTCSPPLPTTMRFCDSRSTSSRAPMRTSSGRDSSKESISTAVL
jgi:hypothetical protein